MVASSDAGGNVVLEDGEVLVDSTIWILKPSVVNKGLGISLLRDYNELLYRLEESSDIREWVLQK